MPGTCVHVCVHVHTCLASSVQNYNPIDPELCHLKASVKSRHKTAKMGAIWNLQFNWSSNVPECNASHTHTHTRKRNHVWHFLRTHWFNGRPRKSGGGGGKRKRKGRVCGGAYIKSLEFLVLLWVHVHACCWSCVYSVVFSLWNSGDCGLVCQGFCPNSMGGGEEGSPHVRHVNSVHCDWVKDTTPPPSPQPGSHSPGMLVFHHHRNRGMVPGSQSEGYKSHVTNVAPPPVSDALHSVQHVISVFFRQSINNDCLTWTPVIQTGHFNTFYYNMWYHGTCGILPW